ncbi:MAG: hypothetical protein M1829_005539 [Trizodia sp. TS-e1964]|nr:MAG: hypothetical protein M1829_005539 [Trizodia sp. TS-e1964]
MPARPDRPLLAHSSLSGGSYIQDHQQYQGPSDQGIDGVVEGIFAMNNGASPDKNYTSMLNAHHLLAGSQKRPLSSITDSGIVHSMTHKNCQPTPDDAEKLVATLFYKSQSPRHHVIHPDTAHPIDIRHLPPQPSPEAGEAPTINLAKYPLEPPAPQPEPLDHLYGAYVSQICLTHFLQVLQDLQHPYQPVSSAHRCMDNQGQPRVMEVTFWPPPHPDYLSFDDLCRHESIWRFEKEWNVEVVLQRDSIWRKHKRLAVFDMDSTLIQQEVIDEIAREAGVEKQVSEITERAMNGELDFTSSLRERVALLKGVPSSVLDKVKSNITLTPGARDLCCALKRLGFKTALLSGGFVPLAQYVAADLGMNYAYANNLAVTEDGKTLTGELEGEIVNAEQKVVLMEKIAQREDIPLKQIIAVGDGANDLLMLRRAGLGVAFNAKPVLQLQASYYNKCPGMQMRETRLTKKQAPARINTLSLQDILFVLGYTRAEQDMLLAD